MPSDSSIVINTDARRPEDNPYRILSETVFKLELFIQPN